MRSVSHILAVIRQPVFIASVGSLLWLVLMVLALCLCQHHARHYSQEQQRARGKGELDSGAMGLRAQLSTSSH